MTIPTPGGNPSDTVGVRFPLTTFQLLFRIRQRGVRVELVDRHMVPYDGEEMALSQIEQFASALLAGVRAVQNPGPITAVAGAPWKFEAIEPPAEQGCRMQRVLWASPPHGPTCLLLADHDGECEFPKTWKDPVTGRTIDVATHGRPVT